jgi:heme a synthase
LYLSANLTNTKLLLGALTITECLANTNTECVAGAHSPRRRGGPAVVVIAVSITGAIAALGDTLFPDSSLAAGMQRDFSNASSLFLRLRLIHTFFAVSGAAYIIWVSVAFLRGRDVEPERRAPARVITLVLLQLAVGALNLTLLAPVWMQLIHLFMADLVWIGVVVMVMENAEKGRASVVSSLERCKIGS